MSWLGIEGTRLTPQEHVHALKTDHHLVVKGSGGTIFALGDAATIQQDKALDHAAELFRRVHFAHVHVSCPSAPARPIGPVIASST